MNATQTAHEKAHSLKAAAAIQSGREHAERDTASVMQRAVKWATENTDVMVWLDENMSTEFGASLADGLNKYGSLTERQTAAVRAKIATSKAQGPVPVVTVARIEEAFSTAKGNGIKRPRLNLDTFTFKPAIATGSNPGAIYVTEDGEYLGKVMGGKFLKVRDCSNDQQARIVAAAADPAAAAHAYGQRTGNCSICRRELTAADSIERFVGPICASKYGM